MLNNNFTMYLKYGAFVLKKNNIVILYIYNANTEKPTKRKNGRPRITINT